MGENKNGEWFLCYGKKRSAATSMLRNGLMLVACLLPRTRVMSSAELLPKTMTGDPTAAGVYVDVHEPCCHQGHRDTQIIGCHLWSLCCTTALTPLVDVDFSRLYCPQGTKFHLTSADGRDHVCVHSPAAIRVLSDICGCCYHKKSMQMPGLWAATWFHVGVQW